MKRFFITLVVALVLCLGFSSQAEAKTTKITLSDSGKKHHTIQESKLGVNEVTVKGELDSDFDNNYTYFKTDKTGYYSFILNKMYYTDGASWTINIPITPLVPMGKDYYDSSCCVYLTRDCKKVVLFLPK